MHSHPAADMERNGSRADALFVARLDEHAGIVRKVAASYAWHDADRADLMQDIVAALWQAWPRYDPGQAFSTWMYRVALNVAISHVRGETVRRRHHVALDAGHELAAAAAHDHEGEQHNALLQAAMENLDGMSRALLLMHLDECGHRDIAAVLGISESNVATKLGRIKDRLRKALTVA
jgi:RNA polymerase sigma-70 factor (ECF subfamily)